MVKLEHQLNAEEIFIENSTNIDEKAEAALKETKARLKAMRKELVDVKNAFKNVASQSKDVFNAAKGKKRRGRKPRYKKK